MTGNPYSPPEAEIKDLPAQSNAPWTPMKSVLLGLAINIGVPLILFVLLIIIYIIAWKSSGMTKEDFGIAARGTISSFWVGILAALWVGICSFLGGLTCARVSLSFNYKLGLILGAIFVIVIGATFRSVAVDVVIAVPAFICVMLGTKYGIAKNTRMEWERE